MYRLYIVIFFVSLCIFLMQDHIETITDWCPLNSSDTSGLLREQYLLHTTTRSTSAPSQQPAEIIIRLIQLHHSITEEKKTDF